MTRNDDFIGQLEDYLDEYEGTTPLPSGVRDAIRAQLPSIQQRPVWWPARRFPEMNTTVKLALAAAAVVVAAFLGIRLIVPGEGLGSPDLTSTPTLSPAPIDAGENHQLIQDWIDAVNREDFDAAAALMAERVGTGAGTVEGPDEIRRWLAELHPCVWAVESIELVNAAYLVEVTFEGSESRTCPAHLEGTRGNFVLEVADGQITRIP